MLRLDSCGRSYAEETNARILCLSSYEYERFMLANSEVGMAGNSKAACEEGRNQRRLYFQDGISEHHTFQKSLYLQEIKIARAESKWESPHDGRNPSQIDPFFFYRDRSQFDVMTLPGYY